LRPDSQNNTDDEYIANLDEQCEANFIKLSSMPPPATIPSQSRHADTNAPSP
jgi:hypothetical protein